MNLLKTELFVKRLVIPILNMFAMLLLLFPNKIICDDSFWDALQINLSEQNDLQHNNLNSKLEAGFNVTEALNFGGELDCLTIGVGVKKVPSNSKLSLGFNFAKMDFRRDGNNIVHDDVNHKADAFQINSSWSSTVVAFKYFYLLDVDMIELGTYNYFEQNFNWFSLGLGVGYNGQDVRCERGDFCFYSFQKLVFNPFSFVVEARLQNGLANILFGEDNFNSKSINLKENNLYYNFGSELKLGFRWAINVTDNWWFMAMPVLDMQLTRYVGYENFTSLILNPQISFLLPYSKIIHKIITAYTGYEARTYYFYNENEKQNFLNVGLKFHF